MAKWTRTHYESTADVLRGALNGATSEEATGVGYVVKGMASMYREDNARFDAERWYKWIYGGDWHA